MDVNGSVDNYDPLLADSLRLGECIHRYKSAIVDKNWRRKGKIRHHLNSR